MGAASGDPREREGANCLGAQVIRRLQKVKKTEKSGELRKGRVRGARAEERWRVKNWHGRTGKDRVGGS